MDLSKHNPQMVSELIFETDKGLFGKFLDKNRTDAVTKLKNLIIAQNNAYSHENIYVAEDEKGAIKGVLVAFRGDEIFFMKELKVFRDTLEFKNFLKIMMIKPIYDKITASTIENDDFYIGNVAVNPDMRGQGIGTEILNDSLKIAREKNCKRVLLDVVFKNVKAKKLYLKLGFLVCGEKKYKWLSDDEGTYGMDYSLTK